MQKKRLIVIGGVAAGMSAASKARRLDPDLDIVVFERGEYVSYGACGLPYYIGGLTESKERLIARTPREFEKMGIKVFTSHEVIDVNFEEKTVKARNVKNNGILTKSYDSLVIATGAEPIIVPFPGVDLENVLTLSTIPDADKIKEIASNDDIKDVVLIGGGYINLELIDAMTLLGKNVRIIERMDTLLNKFDNEFGEMVKKESEKHGVSVHTGESLEEIIGNNKVEKIKTDKGEYPADLVIMALGIRPNTGFIKDSGIEMLKNGAIVVDKKGRTSIPDVYSAGDCATIYHKIKKENVYIPLGTNANKQGKIVGSVIGGEDINFSGILGTAVLKLLDMTFGMTGLTEKEAKNLSIDYGTITVDAPNHAGTYPGMKKITIKLVYENNTHKILGAQLAGEDGVAKRVDVLALAIDRGMTAKELGMVDFSYSPPYATPWDAVAIAANAVK